jgi:hypothetical protein
MFSATHRPSSGAQKLQLQPPVLHMFLVAGRCDGIAIAATGNQKRM